MSATLKIALAAIALSAFAPAAFADRPKEVSVRVSYADLDMAQPAHGTKLLGRIEIAARRICSRTIPHSPLAQREAIDCRRETIAQTVEGLGFSTLTLAWNGKYAATVLAAR